MTRLRIDSRYGFISFSERDEEKAWEYFRVEGLSIRRTRDLFDDEGELLAGYDVEKKFVAAA